MSRMEFEFDAYCRKVLRNEARNYFQKIKQTQEKELLYGEIPVDVEQKLIAPDIYPIEYFLFAVQGYMIGIEDEDLAEQLQRLPVERRDIVLMHYCLNFSDGEIGNIILMPRSTVRYNRIQGLKHLKREFKNEHGSEWT